MKAGGQPHNPLDRVPPDRSVRQLTPHPDGGSQHGVEYKWIDGNGTHRLRVHSPDGTAPSHSNAAKGHTYRVQHGSWFEGSDGEVYHRNAHRADSPHHNPAAADATHIPWPTDIPLPYEGG
ncbi:polymorphic toxin type 30 domain-containing protein [Propionibacteriaceae bacterium Y1685]